MLIALLALADFLRHRERTRLDVTLMLVSLGVPVLTRLLPNQVGEIRWVSTLSAMSVVAQPYLLVRLVEDFRPVRRLFLWFSIGGMALSWVALIIYPSPLPTGVTLVIVAYFVVVESYATLAFLQGSLNSAGPARWRLGFAAGGSALLAVTILFAGISKLAPSIESAVPILFRILPLLAAVSYYLGFVPPGWLRRYWQLTELRRFLQTIAGTSAAERSSRAGQELCQAASRTVGGSGSVAALWNDNQKLLEVAATDVCALSNSNFSTGEGAAGRAWTEGQGVVVRGLDNMSADEKRLAQEMGANSLFAVPITANQRPWGVLAVFHLRGSLFPSDDLDLLALLSEQYALALDNADLVAQQFRLVTEQEAMRQQLQRMLDTTQEGFIAINSEGLVIEWNLEAENTFGWPREEVLGRPLSETIIPPRYQEAHQKGFQRFLATGEGPIFNQRLELSALRRDGAEIPVELTVGVLEAGEHRIFHAFLHDISDRKRAEQQIKERTEQLETANRALEAANKELETFAYSISHDLQAPLRAIAGFSQALLEDCPGQLDALGISYLNRVRNASQFMDQLIDGLLQLSRVSRAEIKCQPVNLSGLTREIVERLQKSQPHRQATFGVSDGLVAQGDPALLQAALENLLGNAWKFTSTHPTATIKFGAAGQDTEPVYFIRDDGVGFDMKYANKLFVAFQRLHGRNEFEGTGIGLATTQRIIHRHGGRIWAEAAVEKGATFYFTLGEMGIHG